jgi:hypothetical protein
VKRFFNEVRTYHHSNGEDYSVTIEGNPNDDDSTITVRVGDDKYTATVDNIDKLPEKYREAAEEAIENARKDTGGLNRFKRRFDVDIAPWKTLPDWRGYFDRLHPRNYPQLPRFDRGEEMLDKIQKQMRDLGRRLEEQEERYRERLEKLEKYYDRLAPKPKEKDSAEREEPVQPTSANGKKA